MGKKIRNIVFDLGGVLIDLDRDACVQAFAELGFPQADLLLDPYRKSGIFLKLELGATTPQELYDHIRHETGRETAPEAINAALCRFLVDLPEYKLDMLRELRKRFKIFMLSNTNAIMMPYIAEHLFTRQGGTMGDYFDRIFLSYEMKLAKPDPEIFQMMARESALVPEETLLIDDSPANVAAAETLGFRTYLAGKCEDFRPIFTHLLG